MKAYHIYHYVVSVLLFVLASCSAQSPQFRCQQQNLEERNAAISRLDGFSVKSIEVDYVAKCKARIISGEKSYSGSCQLILTRNHELQLTILNPLGGTILKVYADDSVVQVNDFTDKKFYEYAADDPRRPDIPIIRDLTIVELQSILWGRLTPQANETLEYEMKGTKPDKLYRRSRHTGLIVTYSHWLEYQKQAFPKLLNIVNQRDGSAVKLAITEFQPGFVCNIKLTNLFK